MMKAVVKAKAEPELWLEEVPITEVRGDDAHSRFENVDLRNGRYSVVETNRLFWGKGINDFFEARATAQRVPERIETDLAVGDACGEFC